VVEEQGERGEKSQREKLGRYVGSRKVKRWVRGSWVRVSGWGFDFRDVPMAENSTRKKERKREEKTES